MSFIGTKDVSYVAVYDINSYTVEWRGFNDSLIKTETVSHGGSVTPSDPPIVNGYEFVGWVAEDL